MAESTQENKQKNKNLKVETKIPNLSSAVSQFLKGYWSPEGENYRRRRHDGAGEERGGGRGKEEEDSVEEVVEEEMVKKQRLQ